MNALEIIFWIALFVVFYTYIGYGILLYILVKLKEAFKKKCAHECKCEPDALHRFEEILCGLKRHVLQIFVICTV